MNIDFCQTCLDWTYWIRQKVRSNRYILFILYFQAKKLKKSAPSGLCHEVSDAESVASVATRDIRSIARSVGDRMARKSSFSFASSDEDLFITQVQ